MRRSFAPFAFALLAACATAGASEPEIANSKWRFVTIDGAKPVADGSKLELLPGRVSAWVGCNGIGGDLAIKGGKLVIGGVVSTMMYCDGLMDQERAVSDLLSADPEWRIEEGNLMLRGGGHSAELKPAG